ncbi:hypothetical protein ACU686_29710 [Yinghuangia aomiensis]
MDSVDLPGELRSSFDELRLLAQHARFLADLPLVQVTSVAWDTYNREAQLSVRRLMGDHPVVPTSTLVHTSSEVEKDSLYLVGRDHQLYLLRPFLTGQVCPMCRTWSTFHVDKIATDLVLKSLEHGHCLGGGADTNALRLVGLL